MRQFVVLGLIVLSLFSLGSQTAVTPLLSVSDEIARPSDGAITTLAELDALYRPRAYRPLWLDGDRPGSEAAHAVAMLGAADDDGLDPADYRPREIDAMRESLTGGQGSLREVAQFDVALSRSFLRYLHDLHSGRVNPRAVGFDAPARDRGDMVALLSRAIADRSIGAAASAARPPDAKYGALRAFLAVYRRIPADTALTLTDVSGAVRPGDRFRDSEALARFLTLTGDLRSHESLHDEKRGYDAALAAAVRNFQSRHGLEADGVLGRATLAALQVPTEKRAHQIELALERLRWLGSMTNEPMVLVNLPMFRLWAWDGGAASEWNAPSLGMNVIIGRANKTETPLFVETMREIVFRPYWNVPRSILLHEVLPLIEKDPGYLQSQNMEIVRGDGDKAGRVEPTDDSLAALRGGALRVRQRPGGANALGLIKFVFPNDEDVYMHGTPAQNLFAHSRRDLSHGCIRVEDPVALAEWALAANSGWTRNRILAATSGTDSSHVRLARPFPVILFYTTALVAPEDGRLHFAEDIYGYDARLDRELAKTRTKD